MEFRLDKFNEMMESFTCVRRGSTSEVGRTGGHKGKKRKKTQLKFVVGFNTKHIQFLEFFKTT